MVLLTRKPLLVSSSFGRPEPRGSTSASRLPWIDAARALAIVTVVLLHVSIGHYYGLQHSANLAVYRWDRVNQVIALIRMPLLFVVSGMLASGKIRRGFTRGNTILSAATNYYLYLVWLAVYGVLFVISGPIEVPFEPARWQDYAIQIVEPRTPLWFVFGLALYLLAFTALRRVPGWIMLPATAWISVWASMTWTVESPLWTRVVLYVVYFALGVYGREALIRLATSSWALVTSATVAYLGYKLITLATLMSLKPLDLENALTLLVLQSGASMFGIAASAQLCRLPWWRAAGTWVGRRTLGIYVMHIPVIVLIDFAVRLGPLAWIDHLTGSVPRFDALYPLLLTAVVIILCVWLEKALGALRLAHLFRLPSRYRRALYRRNDGSRLIDE